MPDTTPVTIPVSLEAARLLQDADRARRIGQLVSDILHPASPDADPLAALIAATKSEARTAGLTDETVDEVMAEHDAERRV